VLRTLRRQHRPVRVDRQSTGLLYVLAKVGRQVKRCDLCGDPVADDVVPAETLAGGVVLECLSCWMLRMEERMTLYPQVQR